MSAIRKLTAAQKRELKEFFANVERQANALADTIDPQQRCAVSTAEFRVVRQLDTIATAAQRGGLLLRTLRTAKKAPQNDD